MSSALIIQPDAQCPPGRLGRWFEDEGVDVRVVCPSAPDDVPTGLVEDALVVLGGDMGANDVAEYPWLESVKELLRSAVASATPTLGVCLGGQLLASAMGGRVEVGDFGMEAGIVFVRPRSAASDDPIFGGMPGSAPLITMHRDAIAELPPGAVWLAESEPYRYQAFRFGPAAWGLQFHPEASPDTYVRWSHYVKDAGEARERVMAGVPMVQTHDVEVDAAAALCVRSFAKFVREKEDGARDG